MANRRLAVFGATGGTGRELTEQALAAGHRVTVLVRRPEALGLSHANLEVRRGDVMDADAVAGAVAGADAVLSALGAPVRTPTTTCATGVANMLAAMTAGGISRILCVSANGLGDGALLPWPTRMFIRFILHPILRHPYADLRSMEATLQASPLDWTIVRPPRLTLGKRVGGLRAAIDEPLVRAMTISRADLAAWMLDHLDDAATVRTTVEVAY